MLNNVYIIIVTYNGMQWIDKCLRSSIGYNVVVIDNNSNDDTVSFIKAHYPSVTLFEQTKNLGFGQANNLGMEYAIKNDADYVFLLNQDAYLFEDSISKLIGVSNKFPEYGIISPIHLNGAGDKLDKGFSNYLNYDKNADFYSDAVLKRTYKAIYDVPFVNAAAWLLPKKTIENVGGFDSIFFHYGEDVNYCQRVKYLKYKIGVVASSFVRHDRIDSKIKEGKRFTNTYYENQDRRCKMLWADINVEDNIVKEQTEYRIKKIKIERYKSLLKLHFSKAINLGKEKRFINNIIDEVLTSRVKNKIKK